MKLTLICLFIQAIFLYRRVGCGIEQAASMLGQASNLLNAGGAPNAGGIASGLLNAGGFSNAANLLNAAGGLSNVGNLMSGSGLLDMAQNSYFTPAPIKAAIVGGKAVAKGVQTYKETGDFSKAGAAATKAGLENAVNVVNGVPGAKLGLGLIKDWNNGESYSTILANGAKEAIGAVPMGEQVRDLAMTGVAAAQAYKENNGNVKEIVAEGVKGTLKNYANKHPIAAEVNKFIDSAGIPKDEPGALPKTWLEKGIEIAQNSPLAPAPLKGAIAAGKAVAKGVQAYKDTGDIKQAGLAAAESGLKESANVVNNVPGAQIGMNLLKDLKNGESVQTILLNNGKEAINFLPADGQAKDLAMKGLGAAQAIKDGKSVTNVVSDGVKGTLMDYASKHPMANKVKQYAEIGEKVANFLPKNNPDASPASFLDQAAGLVNGGIELVKDNPKLNGAVLAGKALAKGVETFKETKDMRKAAKATTNAGLESAAKVVNNVPGAKLGKSILDDLQKGESLQTAILNGGAEAIDFLPVNGPAKDLVMSGIAAAEALKEKKSVQNIVKEGVEGTLMDYASKHPLAKEVQKYVEKGEELAACLPMTEQENFRGRVRHAEKTYGRTRYRRGIDLFYSKNDANYYSNKKTRTNK